MDHESEAVALLAAALPVMQIIREYLALLNPPAGHKMEAWITRTKALLEKAL